MTMHRTMLALVAGLTSIAAPVSAQSWKKKYPEKLQRLSPLAFASKVIA